MQIFVGVPSVQSAQADSEYLEEVVPHHMGNNMYKNKEKI